MGEMLLGLPVLLKVLISLGVILLSHSVSRQLSLSVVLGAVVLAAWCGHGPANALAIAWTRFSSPDNLLLMVILFQVVWLSSQMSAAGVMDDLVAAVGARVSQRVAVAALPAVIGWLPMPGGAIFSAPLVDSCDREGRISPLLKAQTNYWFRHIWEYWWPLYPGVLLAVEITRLEIWQFMLLQLPLSLFSVLMGYLVLLPNFVAGRGAVAAAGRRRQASLLALVAPVLVVIACYAAVRLLAPQVAETNKYLPMIIGLLSAALVLQRQRPLDWPAWKKFLFSRKTMTLALLVALVRVYGAFIDARLPSGLPLVAQMKVELDQWGIPVIAVIMLIPFVSGLVTGIVVGFVGASFPVVVSLMDNPAPLAELLAVTVLAYSFGYMGMMLSPVHVCLIVTLEYFQARLLPSLRGLLLPAAGVLAGAVGMYLLLRLLGPG